MWSDREGFNDSLHVQSCWFFTPENWFFWSLLHKSISLLGAPWRKGTAVWNHWCCRAGTLETGCRWWVFAIRREGAGAFEFCCLGSFLVRFQKYIYVIYIIYMLPPKSLYRFDGFRQVIRKQISFYEILCRHSDEQKSEELPFKRCTLFSIRASFYW